MISTEEMTKDINDLLKKWQLEGHDPVICVYGILMRFTAVAVGRVEDEDLLLFLDDARERGLELHEKIERRNKTYAH